MQITVKEIKENQDDTVTLILDMDKTTLLEFVKIGVVLILTKAVENERQLNLGLNR